MLKHFTNAAKPVGAKQLSHLPCLVVLLFMGKPLIRAFYLLTPTSSNDMYGLLSVLGSALLPILRPCLVFGREHREIPGREIF